MEILLKAWNQLKTQMSIKSFNVIAWWSGYSSSIVSGLLFLRGLGLGEAHPLLPHVEDGVVGSCDVGSEG